SPPSMKGIALPAVVCSKRQYALLKQKPVIFLRNLHFFSCRGGAKPFNTAKSKDCRNQQLINMAAKPLTKSQIATAIAEKANIPKRQAVEVLETIPDLAYKNAKNSFTLPGLGKLVLVNRKARIGRNPATGEKIKIPAKKVVKFRVA